MPSPLKSSASPNDPAPAVADVCLIVEGAYPYVAGGVSSWVDGLIRRHKNLRFSVVHQRSQEARLARILEALKLAVPNLDALELVLDAHTSRPHLQAAFAHWRGPAAKQDEREFSDGTLRLIGLLWALQEPAGPLLLEEPELSLHSGIVRHLAPFIARAQRGPSGRQAFVSTHNDLLMSDPGIGADEVLMIRPVDEGSSVVLGASQPDIRRALSNGLTAADVVMPQTNMAQIDLFAELRV